MKKLPMCKFYTTTGYSKFLPKCTKGHKAGLKCHSGESNCKDYTADVVFEVKWI